MQTVVPLFLLMGMGFFARRFNVLRSGDERILSAYLYYFALPAIFIISLAQQRFTQETVVFLVASIIPSLVALAIYVVLYGILRFSRDTLYLLILSSIFGSFAFFGIPFISFAFPENGKPVATLAAAFISIVGVTVVITTLELYQLKQIEFQKAVKVVGKKFAQNPLILSIAIGLLLALIGVEIPTFLFDPLNMLAATTSPIAIFMLGVFFYGRSYSNLLPALKLSLLRIIFLPTIAFLTTTVFDLAYLENLTLVLMHGMPVAISMIVLSERYNFHKETMASIILISSVSAGIYLNLWLLLIG